MDANQAKHSIHPGFVWGLVPEAPTSPAELVDAISESIPRVPGGCWLRLRLRSGLGTSGLGRRQRRCRRNETEKGRGEDRTSWGTKGKGPAQPRRDTCYPLKKKVIKSKSPCGPTTPINVGAYQPSDPNRFGSNGRELPIQAIKESSLSLLLNPSRRPHTQQPHPAAAGEKPHSGKGGRRRSRARLPRCRSS